ncbi:phage tail assembly chaperone G [Aerococcus urinaeequi]|uniref:phage tail assembly chaperone G n=1 Tax=Aerococcus urinaeequi TaxID=51665 RepID=UPI003AAD5B51
MKKELRLELKDKKGNINTFIQKDIPMRKLFEWMEIEKAIEEGEIKQGLDVIVKKVEFVAGLFDDERVTPEALLDGLDARDFQEAIQQKIWVVLGIDLDPKKEETAEK